jgi:hypothetical protein
MNNDRPLPLEIGMTAEDLLSELRTSRTDLARLVEAAAHDRHTRLVVPQRSVEAWERREPETWTKVSGWLTARGVAIVRV